MARFDEVLTITSFLASPHPAYPAFRTSCQNCRPSWCRRSRHVNFNHLLDQTTPARVTLTAGPEGANYFWVMKWLATLTLTMKGKPGGSSKIR